MARYINGDGDGKVTLTSQISVGGNVGDYVEVDYARADILATFFTGIDADTNNFIQMTAAGVKLRAQNGTNAFVNIGYTEPAVGVFFTIRAEMTATGFEVFIDGSSLGINTASTLPMLIDQFMATGNNPNNISAGELYEVRISTNGGASVTNRWDADDSNGTGSILTDSVGGNTGTLVGFPTDGTQWGGTASNVGPTADAGANQSGIGEGITVTLDGTGSTDDTGITSYTWTQTGGDAVTLTGANTAQPTFTSPTGNSTLIFQLEVEDAEGLTDTDTTQVALSNKPFADAGPNESVISGTVYKLNGDGSNTNQGESADPPEDVTDLTAFAWTQTGGPAVTLNDSSWVRPSFTAPTVTVDTPLTFQLVVTEGVIDSDPSTVVITVKTASALPVADINAPTSVNEGESVTLSGIGSTGGTAIAKYQWTQKSGAYAPLDNFEAAEPQLTVPSASNKNAYAQDIYGPLTQSTPSALSKPKSLDALFDISYLGAFRVNHTDGGDLNGSTSTGNISYNPVNDTIYLAGRQSVFAEFNIPTLDPNETVMASLPDATVRQSYFDILALNTAGNVNDTITGSLVYNGSLIVNSEQFYGGLTNEDTTQVFANADDITTGNKGLLQLGGAAKVAGWMYPIPAEYQTKLGGNYLVGNAGNFSRNGRYSIGPASLSIFNPQDIVDADINGTRDIPSTPLMQFSQTNPITDRFEIRDKPADPLWTLASRSHGAFILPNSNTYIAFGYTTGVKKGVGYKRINDDNSFVGGYAAIDETDRANFFWAFDLDDILAATNLYDPRPYMMGNISHPFDNSAEFLVNGAAYDYVNERLFISLGEGATLGNNKDPLIVVYSFKARTTPVTTVTSELTDMVFELEVTDSEGLKDKQEFTLSINNGGGSDTTAPIITVSGNASTTIALGGTVPTFTASTDDGSAVVVGGDTVDNNTAGTYVITYNATDAAGNQATQVTRTVIVEADTTKPSILVTYTGSLIVDQNGTLPVFNYTATDNVDGDITADVVVGGDTPDASTLGSYTITWDVTDSAGNAATQETRTVVVRDPNAGIPIEFRVNGSTLNAYLITQSFANTYNENQMNWLRSEGYTGSLNDMWYEYLDDLGYGGSLNDKVKAWQEG